MCYCRVTITKVKGRAMSGIRWWPDNFPMEKIRQEVWEKAKETLGRRQIDNIEVEEVPVDHPDVVKYNLGRTPHGKPGR